MPKEKSETQNLNNNLKRLSEITEWFENQEEIDVEEGLKKVKEAVGLIKASKGRLKNIENEFKEIKKEIDIEDNEREDNDIEGENSKDEPNLKDIPF